jgi:hypothetical protein
MALFQPIAMRKTKSSIEFGLIGRSWCCFHRREIAIPTMDGPIGWCAMPAFMPV